VINSSLVDAARLFFGVELPVSSTVLKKAYRRQVLRLHPDAGGDERDFKEMQKAYEELTSSGHVSDVFADEIEYRGESVTHDGIPLSKLGLGLGPTTNGSDCPECQHRGYVEWEYLHTQVCDECRGSGRAPRSVPCRACKGTGKFQQARSKRIVDCRRCNGTGRFVFRYDPRRPSDCRSCGGAGVRYVKDKTRKVYARCRNCDGTGEIPMWNPVLPKGMLNL